MRGLRPHSIQPGQFPRRQPEQIRRGMDVLFLHQLVDDLVAHAVNVERATGDEVLERLFALRAADQTARTAGYRLAFHPFNV